MLAPRMPHGPRHYERFGGRVVEFRRMGGYVAFAQTTDN